MKVRTFVFYVMLAVYMSILATTGYLTFVRFPALSTLPSKEWTDRAATDEFFKQQLLKDIEAARERREQLVKSASHSFDVVLGALLGFLSAAAATLGFTGAKKPEHLEL